MPDQPRDFLDVLLLAFTSINFLAMLGIVFSAGKFVGKMTQWTTTVDQSITTLQKDLDAHLIWSNQRSAEIEARLLRGELKEIAKEIT